MTGVEAVRRTVAALRVADIPHMLTGALASNVYGIERSTKDADIVVHLHAGGTFTDFARNLDPGLRLDEQITFETITGSWRHLIKVPGSPFTIELFLLGSDPHQQEAFGRRTRHPASDKFGDDVFVPTAEDVIIQKVRWGRLQDLVDISDVLAVQGSALDFAYIERWCDAHGTRARLDERRREVPPI